MSGRSRRSRLDEHLVGAAVCMAVAVLAWVVMEKAEGGVEGGVEGEVARGVKGGLAASMTATGDPRSARACHHDHPHPPAGPSQGPIPLRTVGTQHHYRLAHYRVEQWGLLGAPLGVHLGAIGEGA